MGETLNSADTSIGNEMTLDGIPFASSSSMRVIIVVVVVVGCLQHYCVSTFSIERSFTPPIYVHAFHFRRRLQYQYTELTVPLSVSLVLFFPRIFGVCGSPCCDHTVYTASATLAD